MVLNKHFEPLSIHFNFLYIGKKARSLLYLQLECAPMRYHLYVFGFQSYTNWCMRRWNLGTSKRSHWYKLFPVKNDMSHFNYLLNFNKYNARRLKCHGILPNFWDISSVVIRIEYNLLIFGDACGWILWIFPSSVFFFVIFMKILVRAPQLNTYVDRWNFCRRKFRRSDQN